MSSTFHPGADVPTSGVITLDRSACLDLLAPGGHGRVAATMRAVPLIIPVHFVLVGESVLFEPGTGDGLARAVTNAVLAFETDHVGVDGTARWGVHVTGISRVVPGQSEGPWFEVPTDIISGWRTAG